jgi:hypothetical protein
MLDAALTIDVLKDIAPINIDAANTPLKNFLKVRFILFPP